MSRLDSAISPPSSPVAPFVPFFLAFASGILLNESFHPGLFVWESFLVAALSFFAITRLASFDSFSQRVAQRLKLGDAASRFLRRALGGASGLFLAVVAVGGIRHETYCNYFSQNDSAFDFDVGSEPCFVELRVLETPVVRSKTSSDSPFGVETNATFLAETLRIRYGLTWEERRGRTLATLAGAADDLRIGDEIRVVGRLGRPSPPANPGDRDRRAYCRARRVLTTFYADDLSSLERLNESELSLRFRIARRMERARLLAASALRDHLSARNASVAVGMTFGFRNEIDEDAQEAFRRTGTIHLLAISGLHIGLVVGAFAFFLRRIGVPSRIVCAAMMALSLLYLGMTETRAPILRATTIVFVYCVGVLLKRRGVALNTLLCAAVALLAWNPCELFETGAQLSFLAAGTFLWIENSTVYELAVSNAERRRALRERRELKKALKPPKPEKSLVGDSEENESKWRRRWALTVVPTWRRASRFIFRKTWSLFKTGAIIWLVGAPLILKTTNLFTPIAIVANPIVWAPATASLLLAFVLAFVGLAGSCFPIFNSAIPFLAATTNATFDFFLNVLDFLASPQRGAFRLPAPEPWALLTFYGALVFWTLFPRFRPRLRSLLGLAALWLGLVLLVGGAENYWRKSRERLQVDVFSVGHGLAILTVFPDGRAFLYDCGSMTNSRRTAEIVAKNLWNARRTQIDLLILSHADFDHYSGIDRLSELVSIKRACVSGAMFQKENDSLINLQTALERAGSEIVEIGGGENLGRFGFSELTTLHPFPNAEGEWSEGSNANSVVVSLEHLGRKILFSGDLDSEDARFLETPPIKYDFALAPHHGGKTINFEDFYAWCDPTWTAVSGGAILRNTTAETKLRDAGRIVLHTQDDGDVRMIVERAKDEIGTPIVKTTVRGWKSGYLATTVSSCEAL